MADQEKERLYTSEPLYVFRSSQLDLLFNSQEDDEALFTRLKLERRIYRALMGCTDPQDFSAAICDLIRQLGFTDYSLFGLFPTNNPGGLAGWRPGLVLASYDTQARAQSPVMFQAVPNSVRNRHLSMLYHCVADLPADGDFLRPGIVQYVLLTGARMAEYYIAPCGFPQHSCRISARAGAQAGKRTNNPLHSESPLHPADILANTIEVIGKEVCPDLFQRAEDENKPSLSPRARRLLNTMAHQDVNLRGAANMLGLSTDTINKHMAAAKAALGTNTIAGTLWAAAKKGLIDDAEGS